MIRVSQPVVGDGEYEAVKAALDRGYYGHAEKVNEFEDRLREFLGAEHVVCVGNGTAALHLALATLGLGPGDEVVLPSLTFVSSFQAVKATGATPVACDVVPETLAIDLADVERRLTPRTKAVMPVHYAGNPCDMDRIMEFATRAGIRVVEDAAHAFGSVYRGRKIGSFGDVACFSFDSIKNITCGEGGAVVCVDPTLADRLRRKRSLAMVRPAPTEPGWKGRGWRYEVSELGFRYHMSNINAAIGLAQLTKVDAFIARRREICRRYDRAFADVPGIRTLTIDYRHAAPHIYVIRVLDGRRDALMQALKDRDIETSVNYVPNHLQPYFREPGLVLPVTEAVYGEMLTLPLHCALADQDVALIIDIIRSFMGASERRDAHA